MQFSIGQNKIIKGDTVQVSLDSVQEPNSMIKAYAFLKNNAVTSGVVCAEKAEDQGVVYSPNQGSFMLNLTMIPATITKIVIAVSLEKQDSHSFGQISPPMVEVSDSEVVTFQASSDGRTEKALILTEIYRHNGNWKVKALAGGFVGGISDLLANMKVTLPTTQTSPVANRSIIAKRSVSNQRPVNDVQNSAPQIENGSVPDQRQANDASNTMSNAQQQGSQEIDLFSKEGFTTMFGNLFKKGEQAALDLKAGVMKFKSKNFLRASIAGAFMVSAADGSVDSEEKKKLLAFIQSDDALSVFDSSDVIKIFKEFDDAFDFDADAGKAKALKEISKVSGNVEQSKFLIRMIVAIGSADGDFDADEQNVVRIICGELNLSPKEFGL